MLSGFFDVLSNIFDFLSSFFDLIIGFLSDIVDFILLLVGLPSLVADSLSWFPPVVLSSLVAIFSLVVILRIAKYYG